MSFPTSATAAAGVLFSQIITVYEESRMITTSGEVANERLPNRTISGVIQPSSELNIAVTDDGSISDKGFLLMHTPFMLYAYDVTNTSDEMLQTYVIYQGNTWKVNKREDWLDKTSGFNRYILTKYVDTGTI